MKQIYLAGVIGMFFMLSGSVHAALLDSDEVSSYASDITTKFGLDDSTLANYAQNFNVSNQKENVPEVSLQFSPVTPKMGERITATAAPIFFSTDVKKLYYTWYLKRKNCDVSSRTDRDNKICDEDDDGKITPNDWKVTAAKLIARGGYDGSNPSPDREDDNDGYKATYGGDGNVGDKRYCYVHDFNTGKDYELNNGQYDSNGSPTNPTCFHFFPKLNGYTVGSQGLFSKSREDAWGTDPYNPSTAGNGGKDEANLVGVGIQAFEWTYMTGDEVGVVVEGESIMGTRHANASNQIMWAWVKNKCQPKNTQATPYKKTDKTQSIDLLNANMKLSDFDTCFEKNLIDPTQGGQPQRMEVSLSRTPANPVAQISSTDNTNPQGDVLSVQAITNDSTANPDTIWYSWDVKINKNGNFDADFADEKSSNWLSLTKAGSDLPLKTSALTGNGVRSLDINLNLDAEYKKYFLDGTGYLYIKATTRENFQKNVGRTGWAGTVVKVTLVGNQLRVYTVKVQDNAGVSRVSLDTSSEICKTGQSLADCRVTPNQIIGVKVPSDFNYTSYLWTVNGKTVQCTSQISPDCQDDKQSGQIFFPVLGNPGEQYDVSLVATSDSGESVTLDRNFSIVKPAVSIQPITQVGDTGATVWRKVNGYYQNLDGTEATDSSDTELETTTGATVTLEPLFNVADLQGALQMHWLVDGQPVTDPDLTTGQISFTADKLAGENYSVSIQGLYTQPTEIRKALYDIWGVSPTISTETTLEHTVQIAVFQNDNDTASITTHPFKYFGSLLAYIPASVLFAVRLAFSIALALFSLGFVLSFVPETGSRGRR